MMDKSNSHNYLNSNINVSVLLNNDKIQELKEILEDTFPELIKIYLNDYKIQIKEIKFYLKKEKFSEIKRVAHSLKGASASIGCERIAFILDKLEAGCKERDLQVINLHVESIEQLFTPIKKILLEVSRQ